MRNKKGFGLLAVLGAVAIAALIGGVVAGIFIKKAEAPPPNTKLGAFNPIQTQVFQLAGSGITNSATSVLLTSMNYSNGTAVQMADLGNIGFGTIEPGTPKKEEQISFTGISQLSNGQALLTGVTRGLAFNPGVNGCSGSSTLAVAHAGATNFVLSNTACFYNQFAILGNTSTFTGPITFSSAPTILTPSTNASSAVTYNQLVTTALTGGVPMSNTQPGIGLLAGSSQLQNGIATSSVSGTAYSYVVPSSAVASTSKASAVVLTKQDGSIDNSFISQTSTYSFGSIIISSSTFTSTTTFSGPIVGLPFAYGGDGSDGSSTLNASTSLTRDTYYSNLTVATGVVLNTANYRIFVSGTLTVNGTISNNGNNGGNGGNAVANASGTPGAASTSTPAGTLPANIAGTAGTSGGGVGCATPANCGAGGGGGGAGASGGIVAIYAKTVIIGPSGSIQVNGGNGGNGGTGGTGSGSDGGGGGGNNSPNSTNATSTTNSIGVYGVTGGQGGNAAAGAGAIGGTPGSAGTNTTSTSLPRNAIYAINMYTFSSTSTLMQYQGTSGSSGGTGGGGAGGSLGSNKGGGGGGGGAPGSGGVVIIVYSTLINSGSITASAGTPGSPGAAGTNASPGAAGSTGNPGNVYLIKIQ